MIGLIQHNLSVLVEMKLGYLDGVRDHRSGADIAQIVILT